MEGTPDRVLLRDMPLLANVALWVAAVVVVLAVFPAG